MVKKVMDKIDPNQKKLNIAIMFGVMGGYWIRGVIVQELGIDATLWDGIKKLGVYVGGPTVIGGVLVYLWEKVYRPWKENQNK